jgi:hypothetical protein
MNITQVRKLIKDHIDNPSKRPLMLWGKPGTAKSSVVRQEVEANDMRLLDWRLAQKEAIDITGLPSVETRTDGNRTTIYAPPELLPREGERAVVFLDEIVQAPMMTQNAVSELVLDRTIGGGSYRFPKDCIVIAAGNYRTDRAGTFEMPAQLRGRFRHVDVTMDIDDWAPWAFKTGIREEVIAFLRFRPNLLSAFDPNERSSPTARTWEMVSDDLEFAMSNPKMRFETIAASVGSGPATEFTGYLNTFLEMPDPDQVFADPENAPVPDQPGVMWALGVALAARVNKKTSENMFTYLGRLSQDYSVAIATDAVAREPSVIVGKKATAWAVKHAKFLVGM